MLDINERGVWQTLAESDKPTVLYGMGNGAQMIISAFESAGVRVSDIFASDGFVRGHSFMGHKILSYSQICEKYDDFNIVLAFAVRQPEMLEKIKFLGREHNLFAPDVPIAGGGLFTREYFEENRENFEFIYSRLSDDESRRVYENIINFKISGKVDYLYSATEYDKSRIYKDILRLCKDDIIVDMGAYDGDTVREFTEFTGGCKRIYAIEPDAKNYAKLLKNTADIPNIITYNMAAWSRRGTLMFSAKAGKNSSFEQSGKPIEATDIDGLINGPVTMLKMDIEGAELEALEGCEQTIKRYAPKLYICAYHRNEDLFALPKKILELNGGYKLYFRHSPYIPAWESNFYCTI